LPWLTRTCTHHLREITGGKTIIVTVAAVEHIQLLISVVPLTSGAEMVPVRRYISMEAQILKASEQLNVGSGVCPGVIPPWNSKIRVEVFGQLNAQSLIGIVVYAHISGPVTNGVYNTNNLRLGATASDTCNCGACYMGVHVHMERDFGGFSNSFSCGAPLYVNATWIYRWLII